jgi:hypothetical protein
MPHRLLSGVDPSPSLHSDLCHEHRRIANEEYLKGCELPREDGASYLSRGAAGLRPRGGKYTVRAFSCPPNGMLLARVNRPTCVLL